jgi:neutral ceramidase
MIFTNNFTESVIVFLFNQSDLLFPLVVADPIANPNLALAAYEEMVDPGKTTSTLNYFNRPCYVGIKLKGILGAGRFGPYLVTPTLTIYPDNAQLELKGQPDLLWTNRPVPLNTNTRLTPKDLAQPLPKTPGYVIGVGKASVGDPAAADSKSKLPMQGWADSSQLTTRIESPLIARAFIIGDPAQQSRVVLVVADIWSCTIAIKQEVVRRLQQGGDGIPYREDNIWISGTHTHSGPAGFSHHFLYNATAFGFDAHVFECIVAGIVQAIENAHTDIGSGKVYVNNGSVRQLGGEIGRNRSATAFNMNPKSDRDVFPNQTDDEMLLLKFVKAGVKAGDPEVPVGSLNWYGLHPTNRGFKNTLVNGDNKGRAAILFENDAVSIPNVRENFVAAFANACCGDVSGNFNPGAPTGVFDPPLNTNQVYQDRMENAATVQNKVARLIFDKASTELTGPIGIMHQFIDLPARTGVSGAIGISMAAGSVEDGGPKLIPEGVALSDPTDLTKTTFGPLALATAVIMPLINQILASLTAILNGSTLISAANNLQSSILPSTQLTIGHYPKPIMLMTGAMKPIPFTPNILPVQLLQIGRFALLGVPGEVSTVAGLRLRRAVAGSLSKREVNFIAVGTYANGYSQYITTPEEYDIQHYEGASTLFGRDTLYAYEKAFRGLADALVARNTVIHDSIAPDLKNAVFSKSRMTFRNLSKAKVRFRIFLVSDTTYTWRLFNEGDFEVQPNGGERAVIIPFPWNFLPNVQVVIGSSTISGTRPPKRCLFPGTSDLVVIQPNGTETSCSYFPTSRNNLS